MRTLALPLSLFALALTVATPASASDDAPRLDADDSTYVDDTWASGARFFMGGVGSLAFPPGAIGPAGTGGIELGVSAESGIGFGLSMMALGNPPAVPELNLPKAQYGFGAAVDLRWYIQTIEPLSLYPALSVGFVAGPSELDGKNAVMPLFNLGFGGRVKLGDVYFALGLGVSGLFIPFLNLSVGWEPSRRGA